MANQNSSTIQPSILAQSNQTSREFEDQPNDPEAKRVKITSVHDLLKSPILSKLAFLSVLTEQNNLIVPSQQNFISLGDFSLKIEQIVIDTGSQRSLFYFHPGDIQKLYARLNNGTNDYSIGTSVSIGLHDSATVLKVNVWSDDPQDLFHLKLASNLGLNFTLPEVDELTFALTAADCTELLKLSPWNNRQTTDPEIRRDIERFDKVIRDPPHTDGCALIGMDFLANLNCVLIKRDLLKRNPGIMLGLREDESDQCVLSSDTKKLCIQICRKLMQSEEYATLKQIKRKIYQKKS